MSVTSARGMRAKSQAALKVQLQSLTRRGCQLSRRALARHGAIIQAHWKRLEAACRRSGAVPLEVFEDAIRDIEQPSDLMGMCELFERIEEQVREHLTDTEEEDGSNEG